MIMVYLCQFFFIISRPQHVSFPFLGAAEGSFKKSKNHENCTKNRYNLKRCIFCIPSPAILEFHKFLISVWHFSILSTHSSSYTNSANWSEYSVSGSICWHELNTCVFASLEATRVTWDRPLGRWGVGWGGGGGAPLPKSARHSTLWQCPNN